MGALPSNWEVGGWLGFAGHAEKCSVAGQTAAPTFVKKRKRSTDKRK